MKLKKLISHIGIIFFTFIQITFLEFSYSATLYVTSKDSISKTINLANDGDTIIVENGLYKEQIIVDKKVLLLGNSYPVIDGQGRENIIKITAPGSLIRGFKIVNSGSSLSMEHSAIEVDSAPNTIIDNNHISDVLFGIYLKNSPGSIIKNNLIEGKNLKLPNRGDGIRLWYSSNSKVLNNKVYNSRDLVIWWSNNTLIKNNEVRNGRYGLHYMYSNNNVFEDNLFVGNSVGGFLMYSNNIKFFRNVFALNQGIASGYGVGFKDLDDVVAKENFFINNRIGLYLDNSPHLYNSWNNIENNVLAYNDIGSSLMPSIERNIFINNSFIENSEQVEVRGGGTLDNNKWYQEGSGNYWSDYAGYDKNKDGIGDIPYVYESLFEQLIDKYPNLRLFINSPASKAIELASEAIPLIKPDPKLTDKFPLTRPYMPERDDLRVNKISAGVLYISFFFSLMPVLSYLLIRRKSGGKI